MKREFSASTVIKGTAVFATIVIVILLAAPYIMVEQNRIEPPNAVLTASKTLVDVGEVIISEGRILE